MTHAEANNNPAPTEIVKKEITEYIDYLTTHGNLNITTENCNDLAFKLKATVAKYVLEYQHQPQQTPKEQILNTVGKLYNTTTTCKYLNITEEELNQLVDDHLILKLDDRKGRNGYPAAQFKNGKIRPDLQKIIKTTLDFPSPLDPTQPFRTPWEVAFYLTSEDLRYGGRNLAEHLDKYPEKLDEEIDMLLASLNTSACYY